MIDGCNLASTGASLIILQGLALLVLAISVVIIRLPFKKGATFTILILVASIFGSALIMPHSYVSAAASECQTTSGNVIKPTAVTPSQAKQWLPQGRFVSEVFGDSDIQTVAVPYGIQSNFSHNDETIYMTINRPNSNVDQENQRPVIIAITGGDTAGFCDSSFAEEQAAMLHLAKLGYVTVTLTPLLDADFCDGEPDASYFENLAVNRLAADQAITFLQDNAQTYGIDSDRMALYGYSIGGQTALLQLRNNFVSSPSVRVIAAFSAIIQDSSTHNTAFGVINPATASSPSVYMLSFQPDIGFGAGVNPDAEADCSNLVSLGYDCTFQGIQTMGHGVHPNTTVSCTFLASVGVDCHTLGIPVVNDAISVPSVFEPYLYQKLVLDE